MLLGRRQKWRAFRYPLAGIASFALVAGFTVPASPAAAQSDASSQPTGHPVVEQELLDELADEGTTDFWVYLRDSADLSAASGIADRATQGEFVYQQLTQTAADSQAGLVGMLDSAGIDYESFWLSNAVLVTGDSELVDRVAALPEVEQVTATRTYELPQPVEGSIEERIQNVEWGVERVNAPDVWDEFGVHGEGIVIGTIDTGVQYDHPALVEQYRGNLGDGNFDHNYQWHDPSETCGSPSLVPCDNHGHGTHVTGTILGDDGGDNQVGVAPGAQWIAAKGCEGQSCSDASLLSSGQFILAPTDLEGENEDPSLRPHVVNNSWGGGATNDPWYEDTVDGWVSAGIFPVFSNGNSGPSCGSAGNPANLEASYATGSFDINDNIAASSSRGPSAWDADLIKPNIAAPGVNIRSSLPGDGYGPMSGTSMASPHVAGAVALMWSAAVALDRDIDATRELLGDTAESTEDLTCGGEPDNNNVWGQGKLDAYQAVAQAPRGPTGVLEGEVTDADSGAAIVGAEISVSGEVDRDAVTGDDGTYSFVLPVGEFTVEASAFGYASEDEIVNITEDETTVQDFDLQAVDSVTVSGEVTDGSGHGWALYSEVNVIGTGVSTFTDPLTGHYELTLPRQNTYTLEVVTDYPGYADHSEQIDIGDSDVEVDMSLTVENCQIAPGYRVEGMVAKVTSSPNHFETYFDELGVVADYIPGGSLPQVTDNLSDYDVVVWGYNTSLQTPTQEEFDDFIAATDAAGVGVVFLDHAFIDGNGLRVLSDLGGNPAEADFTSATATGTETFYEITEEHEVLGDLEVGEQILHEPGQTGWLAWFHDYEGDGRQVIAHSGRTGDDGVLGDGIGVQERADNRHVLLSNHSATAGRGPQHWSDESEQIFRNAVGWASQGAFTIPATCAAIDGGLVLGQVSDLNTGDGIVGATVTSETNPDDQGTSMEMADDPAIDDGFYWLFSSETGEHDFTATASGYAADTVTVDVTASGTSSADFELGSGHLRVEPSSVGAELGMGESAQETFTITNDGTGAAELEFSERGGDFEMLGDSTASAELTRNPQADPNAATAEDAFLNAGATGPAQVTPLAPGDIITSWPTGLSLGWGVGFDGDVWLSDPNDITNTEFTVDGDPTGNEHNASWAGTWPGDMTYLEDEGVMCQVNVGGDNGIHCWDPETGDVTDSMTGTPWSNISQRGLGYNPNDDTFYTGGWNEGIIYQVAGFSHPTPGETLSQCNPSDASIAGLSYNPTADLLWMTNNAATDAIYLLDPEDCSTLETLEFPNGQGFAGAGIEINHEGELWLTNQNDNAAYLIESGVAHDHEVDVPWLEVSHESATLQPGESVTVTITMDGDVDQPGTYTAGVAISHDTPHDVAPVGVTMEIRAPNNWGKVTGTVTGVDCEGDIAPIDGAIVQVNGSDEQVTLFTDSEGNYGYWMAVANNPLQVIVATGNHVPEVDRALVVPRSESATDFELAQLC